MFFFFWLDIVQSLFILKTKRELAKNTERCSLIKLKAACKNSDTFKQKQKMSLKFSST